MRIQILILTIFFICFNGYSQNGNFYKLDGTIIAKSEGKSINNIVNEYFNNIEMVNTYFGSDDSNCQGYEIIFKKYTETPLFVLGLFPKRKKKLKKCIEGYNVIETYSGYSFKNDLDEMIDNETSKEQIIKIFGNPQSETIDKEKGSEIVIYNYNKFYGTVRFDLIFVNNILNRYILNK